MRAQVIVLFTSVVVVVWNVSFRFTPEVFTTGILYSIDNGVSLILQYNVGQ